MSDMVIMRGRQKGYNGLAVYFEQRKRSGVLFDCWLPCDQIKEIIRLGENGEVAITVPLALAEMRSLEVEA